MVDGSVASLLVTAGVVGAFGVLIRTGRVDLVAGYDPDRVTDEEGLATFVGTNTLYVAALALLVAAVEYRGPAGWSDVVWIGFTLGVVGLAGRMVVGSRRYEESD